MTTHIILQHKDAEWAKTEEADEKWREREREHHLKPWVKSETNLSLNYLILCELTNSLFFLKSL